MQESEYAKTYELERTFWWFVAKRRASRTLLEGVELVPPATGRSPSRRPRILDAGCGTGGNLEWLAERGRSFGVDLSETALQFCRRRMREATRSAASLTTGTLLCGELAHLPFADDTFDLVTAFDVLYHKWVVDDGAAMGELARVCRPGGYVLITDSALPFLRGPHDQAWGGARRYTRATLRQVVEQSGCKVRRLSYFHFLLFPVIAAQRLLERWFSSPERAKSDLQPVHPLLNALLKSVYAIECPLLHLVPLPIGSSIICLAQKSA